MVSSGGVGYPDTASRHAVCGQEDGHALGRALSSGSMRKLEYLKLYATYLGENDAILPIMGALENGECPNLRSLTATAEQPEI